MADKIVKLKDGNDYLYPQSALHTLDTTNILYDGGAKPYFWDGGLLTYTASQDCFVAITIQVHFAKVSINNVKVFPDLDDVGTYNWYEQLLIPLNKGDTISMDSEYFCRIRRVFGVKQK